MGIASMVIGLNATDDHEVHMPPPACQFRIREASLARLGLASGARVILGCNGQASYQSFKAVETCGVFVKSLACSPDHSLAYGTGSSTAYDDFLPQRRFWTDRSSREDCEWHVPEPIVHSEAVHYYLQNVTQKAKHLTLLPPNLPRRFKIVRNP